MSQIAREIGPSAYKSQVEAKRPRGRLLLAAVAMAVAAFGAWYLYEGRHPSSASHPQTEVRPAGGAAPAVVQTTRLSPGGIVLTSAQIGSVEAYESADLYAKVSGYLKTLTVDYGTRVKKGQLLAEIDDPEVIQEKERATAELTQARAMELQAEARLETAKADYKAAQAAVQQARSEIRRAASKRSYRSKVLARYRDLVARNAETQQVVDEQEENYEAAVADEYAANAAEVTARAQADAARAKIDQAEADLAEAKAHVQVDAASLAKATAIAEYTRILAPYDGVITRRNLFPGAFVRSAAEGTTVPLLSIQRTDKVRVVTQVPDLAVPETDIGDPAEITLGALPGRVFKGTVSRYANTEDVTTRTMHTEIDLPNPDGLISPGMSGIARILLGTHQGRSTLPASCLVGETRGDRADVLVVRDGKAKKVQVRIGADDGLRVEVVDGLSPDDDVILDTGAVADGTPVQATPPALARGPGPPAS
ncbi:MAG: efflux RND transporter periplasmic adaptor subunit [Isosphaeraceae bacterium]